MSNLVTWAEAELARLAKGDDEDGMQRIINKDILEIVRVFSEQDHSGFSASYALGIIRRLLDWKPITPLTGDDDEWGEVYDAERKTQQNKRCSSVFRENYDNSTAYDIYGKVFSDNGGESWFTRGGRGSSVPVTFPYRVPDKPEYIILDRTDDAE